MRSDDTEPRSSKKERGVNVGFSTVLEGATPESTTFSTNGAASAGDPYVFLIGVFLPSSRVKPNPPAPMPAKAATVPRAFVTLKSSSLLLS